MKIIFRLFIFLSICYGLFSWWRIVTTTAPDFSVYYGAAKLLVEKQSLSGNTGLYTGFGYPPTTLLLFLPFLLFPYEIAQGIWVSLSFLLVPVCVFLSFKIVEGFDGLGGVEVLEKIMVWSGIFFWSFPTRWTLGMGQINLLSLFFLLGYLSLQFRTVSLKNSRYRYIWQSILLALLLISKPQTGLIFLFLVFFKTQWKVIGWSLVLVGLASCGVGTVFGWEYFIKYFTIEVPQLLVFTGREIYFNQSLGGFFSRVSFVGIARLLTQISSVVLLGGLGVIGGLEVLGGRFKRTVLQMICLFLPVYLLVEPLGWQHHLVFLMPVYIWLFETREKKSWGWLIILVISFLLISFNIKDPSPYSSTQLLRGTILSHGFWGTLLLLGLVIKKQFAQEIGLGKTSENGSR